MIEIRVERPQDAAAICELHLQAFHPSPHEARLVELLRQAHKTPISLVALAQGRLIGHILFSPITLVPAQPAVRGLGLAPVGVLPEFQRQGIGSQLIERGLQACQESGYDLVVVLGDPRYYMRFGFARAKAYGLENEYGADDAFMAVELRQGALDEVRGTVKYSPEFHEAGC